MSPYEFLPLEENTKTTLIEMAHTLRPLREELICRWMSALGTPALMEQHNLSGDVAQLIIRALVDRFIECIEEGRFDDYLREVSDLSEEYIRTGLSYQTMVMAMHLYEEASLPLLMREYPEPDKLIEVLSAQDHLYHNVLILLASGYFRQLNAELESRAEQLQESYRRHEQFVSMVAHELRSPLSIIIGYIQLAVQAVERGEPVKSQILDRALVQSFRLKRLMEDLQDASSINIGHFEVRKAVCDLVALVKESVQQQSSQSQTHPLTVSGSESLMVMCDADRITQVIDNLVGNALKYSSEGGRVTVTVTRSVDEATVSVEDQGAGISPEDLAVLFQPFSRLYRESHVKGTGLGLFISKAIIEAHGGKIWAESQPGVGSKFSFSLPLKSPTEEPLLQ